MKKLFALAMAAVMAAGMTTVAFADTQNIYVSNWDSAWYVVGSDNRVDYVTDVEPEGGDTIAIPMFVWDDKDDDGEIDRGEKDSVFAYTSSYDGKVYIDDVWSVGEPAEVTTGWVNFEKVQKQLPWWMEKYGDRQIKCVLITLPENDTNKVEDLAGEIRVGRSKSAAKKSPFTFDLEPSYYADNTLTGTSARPWDGGELISGETGIVSFDKEEGEIDIEFEDVATFTVDISGQGKLNLAWNTSFNKEFGAMYDYANLTFVNFEGTPSFNKNGTLMVYAEPDTFFYEVTEDGAKKVDAEYDEDYEAWVLTTRTLSSYVISDVELTEKTVTDTEDDTTDDGSKPIPDTGR